MISIGIFAVPKIRWVHIEKECLRFLAQMTHPIHPMDFTNLALENLVFFLFLFHEQHCVFCLKR